MLFVRPAPSHYGPVQQPRWWLAPAGALLIVLAAKLMLIGAYGSPAPFWDQWNGEGGNIIAPYIEGRFGWHNLFYAHNDHRIVFTRLLTLGLLELNGGWNPIAEMAAGAVLHVSALASLLWLLRDAGPKYLPIPFAALLLIAAFPYGIEDTLWGFQSQFYFLIGLSGAGVILVASEEAFSPKWLAGALMSALAFFAMASGLLSPAIGAMVSLAQIVIRARGRSPRELAGVGLLLVIVAFDYSLVVHYEPGDSLKATGVHMFVSALAATSGWPLKGSILAPVWLNLPLLLLAWRTVQRRTAAETPSWRVLALGAWLAATCVATAYQRGASPLASRYLDLFYLISVANLAAFALLLMARTTSYRNLLLFGGAWFVVLIAFFTLQVPAALRFAEAERVGPIVQERAGALRQFIVTKDRQAFDRPFLHTPFADPVYLSAIASRPSIRGSLPATFGASDAERASTRAELFLRGGFKTGPGFQDGLADLGFIILAITVGMLTFLIVKAQLTQPSLKQRFGMDDDL